MLTQPPVRFDGSVIGAGVSSMADKRAPRDMAFGPSIGAAVATFSQAVMAHRLGAALLDAVINDLPVGLLVLDGNSNVSFANAAARALGADAVTPLRGLAARALRTDRVVAEVLTVGPQAARTRLDSRRSLAVRAIPVRNDGARAHAAVVTVNDITAQARADAWEPAIASLMSL